MRTKNPFGFRSHGRKNFYYLSQDRSLVGVYAYLARPAISSVTSIEEADALMRSFCKHELGFESISLIRCARRINKNWELFVGSISLNQ